MLRTWLSAFFVLAALTAGCRSSAQVGPVKAGASVGK